eukprot:14688375-Alexandrium_andersonii.AAC.1
MRLLARAGQGRLGLQPGEADNASGIAMKGGYESRLRLIAIHIDSDNAPALSAAARPGIAWRTLWTRGHWH